MDAARRAQRGANSIAIGVELRRKLIDIGLVHCLIVGSVEFHLIVIEVDLRAFLMRWRPERCRLRCWCLGSRSSRADPEK